MASKVPRTPKKAPKVAPTHNPKAEPGDNSLHGEEADRVQLISIVSKISAADEKIVTAQEGVDKAKVPLSEAKASRKAIIKLGTMAGFTEDELLQRLEEMKTPTREMARRTERERKHRRWLGIIDDDQERLQLGDETPIETKDEAHWAGEGYKAGLRQQERKAPPECHERFVQVFLSRYDVGLKEVLEANVPGGHRLRAQAAADFKDDNPEVDLDAAARKLKGSGFMDKPKAGEPGGPDDPTYNFEPDDCPQCSMSPGFQHLEDCPVRIKAVAGPATPADSEAGFEATEEELAGQKGREVIKAKREGTTPGAPADVI